MPVILRATNELRLELRYQDTRVYSDIE